MKANGALNRIFKITLVFLIASFMTPIIAPVPTAQAVGDPQIDWIRQFGSSLGDGAEAVAVGPQGEIYVSGGARAALPGQPCYGGVDAFVRKYDSNGNEIWTRQFGTTGEDGASAVAAGPQNELYVSGWAQAALPGQSWAGARDAFVRKYDSNGNAIWTRQFGTTGEDRASGVAVGPQGEVYVSGSVHWALPGQTSVGPTDAFVRKYDSNGNEIWTRQFGTPDEEVAIFVAIGPQGEVYVSGSTEGALPGQTFLGKYWDAFVRKYDSNGNEIWTRQFGTAEDDGALGVAAGPQGEVYVSGWTNGTFPGQTCYGGRDAFVRKYDSNGNVIWTRQFGTASSDSASAVTVGLQGEAHVSGPVGGVLPGQTSEGSFDAFVRTYDYNGNEMWTRQFGTLSYDELTANAVDEAGNIYVAGYTTGIFPGQAGLGGDDAFVVKFAGLPQSGYENIFRPPYRFSSQSGWNESLLMGEAFYHSSVDRLTGVGNITIGAMVPPPGGDGKALARLNLGDQWKSEWSGTACISASFNVDGFIQSVSVSLPPPLPSGFTSVGITLKARLQVNDVSNMTEVLNKEVTIYDKPPEWKPISFPETDKVSYHDSNYLIQGIMGIEKDHTYSWNYDVQMFTWVIAAGFATVSSAGNIEAELLEVRVTTPPLELEPQPLTYNENAVYIAVGSPVAPLIIEPEGKRIGFDISTGQEINELGDAWYSGHETSPQIIVIPTPTMGNYEVLLFGTDAAPYKLMLAYTEGAETTAFTALDIPVSSGALHQYTIDWDALSEGQKGVTLQIDSNGDGEFDEKFTCDATLEIPIVGPVTAPVNPVQANTEIDVEASFTDAGILDTHTATWDWGDGANSTGAVTESNGSGNVTGSHIYTAPGVYTITLTLTENEDGASAQSVFQYIVVYDPSAGFVTGGGWINSPVNAYVPEPSLAGKATFGFVSKYQKGSTVPTGNTEFQFRLANLNFKSTNYDWLVTSGAKAKYKGTGTINDGGNYGFMLSAIDGQINGGGGVDKFRIKIWDKETGNIVYDNQIGASDTSDTADPITAIAGGSIVIHK
jgi:hypothetical protein